MSNSDEDIVKKFTRRERGKAFYLGEEDTQTGVDSGKTPSAMVDEFNEKHNPAVLRKRSSSIGGNLSSFTGNFSSGFVSTAIRENEEKKFQEQKEKANRDKYLEKNNDKEFSEFINDDSEVGSARRSFLDSILEQKEGPSQI